MPDSTVAAATPDVVEIGNTSPATPEEIRAALLVATDAAYCLALAAGAEASGDKEVNRACLEKAVALDRGCQPALLNLAALALDEGDTLSTFSFLEEAARIAPLAADIEPLRQQLATAAQDVPELGEYLAAIGRTPIQPAEDPLSVLVIADGLGEQAAGLGRALFDLVHGLKARGHRIDVLTNSRGENETAEDFAASVRTALDAIKPRLAIVGNLQGGDDAFLDAVFAQRIPVLQWLASVRSSFSVTDQARAARYHVTPVSRWTAMALSKAGCDSSKMEIMQPGIRLDASFRLFLPDTGRLRICFAAPLRPVSGAETMVRALVELAKQGTDFVAELAGTAPDPAFLERLRDLVREHGLTERVRFSAASEAGAFIEQVNRCNVFVSAAQFPEALAFAQIAAMAAGLAVVASGTGSAREIVRDGVDGLLFRAGDAKDLAQKLTALREQPEIFVRLQRASQARAMGFSVANAVTRFEHLAQAVLRESANSLP